MINMKPYDPAHDGEFRYKGNDLFDRILCTDAKGIFPIKTLSKNGIVYHHYADGKCECSSNRLMCVIPKREARMIEFDKNGQFKAVVFSPELSNAIFREVMPHDISQEKARALTEAARAVITDWDTKVTELADLQESIYRLRTVFSSFL